MSASSTGAVADLGAEIPCLDSYDLVVVNSSAGKDSQAMLAVLIELAQQQGVDPRERFVVVHADLGRVEWPGTVDLAREQAAAYGLRFEVVRRGEDLLAQVEKRRARLDEQAAEAEAAAGELLRAAGELPAGLEREQVLQRAADACAFAEKKRGTSAWPSGSARYCTSDQKTSQVAKLLTREVKQWRERTGLRRRMRILNTLGIRADESPDRAKKEPLHRDRASNGRREVTRWLPIFEWTVEQVWATIHRSGLPYHPAYDAGMPRLSCCFCVLAGRRELVLAARLNPELAQEYVAVEDRTGDQFKANVSMREIVAESRGQDDVVCSAPRDRSQAATALA